DKYNRTLAYVFLKDGTFVNAEIIKRGFGHAYTRFPFKYLDDFRSYEKTAREKKIGLWAESKVEENLSSDKSGKFSCSVPKTCKQMSSCEEARFYLVQCKVSSLDRDGDGTPCESLCK